MAKIKLKSKLNKSAKSDWEIVDSAIMQDGGLTPTNLLEKDDFGQPTVYMHEKSGVPYSQYDEYDQNFEMLDSIQNPGDAALLYEKERLNPNRTYADILTNRFIYPYAPERLPLGSKSIFRKGTSPIYPVKDKLNLTNEEYDKDWNTIYNATNRATTFNFLTKQYPDKKNKEHLKPALDYLFKQKNGGSISQQGYRDDSPYRNRESIDIHSPNGLIDMSETGIPILANGRYLPPYSGMHQFKPGVVREERVMRDGGNFKFQNGGNKQPAYSWSTQQAPSQANTSIQIPTTSENRGIIARPQADINKELEERRQKNIKLEQERKATINRANLAQSTQGFPTTPKQWADQTQAIGDKMRVVSTAPNVIDDYLNPLVWVGNMATNVGQVPLDVQQGNYLKATKSLATPLAVGAIGSIGANTQKQFLNNTFNPLASSHITHTPALVTSKIAAKKTLQKQGASTLGEINQNGGLISDLGYQNNSQYKENPYAFGGNVMLERYKGGGSVSDKKSTLSKLKKALSLRENLGNLDTEQGYNTPLKQVLRTAIGLEGEDYSNEAMSPIAREQDAFRMYLGLPSKTGAFEQTGSNKYRIRDYNKLYPDTLLSDEAVKDWGVPHEDGVPDPVDKSFDLYPYDDFVMGKHYVTKGKDKKGEYLKYYDKFNFDPKKHADEWIDENINPKLAKYLKKATPVLDKLESAIFNPFELEDKVYYDPKTKLRSDIVSQQNKQKVYPGQPIAIPADFKSGGEMIKRADGSYSRRGLWDNIRENAGSGKKPTKEMLKQENKIKAFEKKANGGAVWEILEETPIMQTGGRSPIVVNDPKDSRLQSYQDSTNAYNSSINRLKLLEKYAYDKNGNDRWIMEDKIKDVNKSNPKYKPKFKNSGYDPISFNITSNNSSGDTETESVEFKYKKPVQPVVYKPKEDSTTPIMYNDRVNNRNGRTFIERVPVGEIDEERLSRELDEILNADKVRQKQNILQLPQLNTQISQEQQQLEFNNIPFKKGSYFTVDRGGQQSGGAGFSDRRTQMTDYYDNKTGKKLGTYPTKKKSGGKVNTDWEIIKD